MTAAYEPLVAGVELGGTKVIAVIGRGRTILGRAQIATGDPVPTLQWLNRQLLEFQARHGAIAAIGIASFGPVGVRVGRPDYGRILRTPKPGWSGVDIMQPLMRDFDCSVAIDTDVSCAALAEGRWGAAQNCDVHAYVTIGTGIGGGLIVNGRPIHGLMHPEMGHIRVRRRPGDQFAGLCPFHGDCLEGLASGPAIAARTGRPAHELEADHPIWTRVAAEVSELIANLILIAATERIVIGGGVGNGCPFLLPMIHRACHDILADYGAAAEAIESLIVKPDLGLNAGPLGSLALARSAVRSQFIG